MKKFLIILTALLLVGAGYFTYDKWVKHSDLTAWSFVPSDAALVIDVKLVSELETLDQNPVWNNLIQTSSLSSIESGISFLDSINGTGGFSAIFRKLPALISVHKVSNENVDYLFVLDIKKLSQNTFISAVVGRLQDSGYRFKTRNYNGFKISEIGIDDQTFTYIFYKNFFLASFTPYLVEDAIRTIEESDIQPFNQVHQVTATSNIHINYQQLWSLTNVFASERISLPLLSGSYESTFDSTYLTLSGLSTATGDWLSTHKEDPTGFEMAEIIPSNTASLLHLTSVDFSKWEEQQANYLDPSSAVVKLRDSLKAQLDFNVEQVFDLVDSEIGLAWLESRRPDDNKQLFILKVKDANASLSFFESLAERIAYSRGDSVYTESYSENEIRFLPIRNFPTSIVGDIAQGFDRCFYFNYRNYIVFSNNLQELKSMVSATQSEDTWGKSLQMNDFLDRMNGEANVSLIVNVPRYWPKLESEIKSKWTPNLKKDKNLYEKIELAAFQFTSIDDHYFTNFTFSQPTQIRIASSAKTSSDNEVTFANPMITKPHLVRTHAHSYFDILVQDSAYNLYFLDRTFSSLWNVPLNEPMIGEVFEMDYYRNGKTQYAFATSRQIHVIDRTGSYIPGFPKTIPGSRPISYFNLIDYEKSRNYRLGITDDEGKVYLADKDLKLLEGWDPIPYRRPATNPLRHARLGRRDVMISIQKNGVINMTNRRGIKASGFPFNLSGSIVDNYFLSTSNSLGRSSISVITDQGELVEVNLEGIVINRDQLIKDSPDTKFKFVPDRGEKSFIIVRNEGNTYEVLDAKGNLLFSKDYLSGGEILVQFYQFGAGKDLITFTDTANERLYIYDIAGELVTGNPLKSSSEISILYSTSKKELQVYTTSGSNLEYYKFNY